MGDGLHSHHGQAVRLLAEEEHRLEQEPVLIRLPNTVAVIVLDLLQKARLATVKTVQVII